MTALSHLDPDFGSVFAIQGGNEVLTDASQTPGYGDCKLIVFNLIFLCCSFLNVLGHFTDQVNFVKAVRAAELALGIQVEGVTGLQAPSSISSSPSTAFLQMAQGISDAEISKVMSDAAPILASVISELGINPTGPSQAAPLYTR